MQTIQNYLHNVRRFSPEARLYLLVATLQGVGWGIFRLFFNFYVLSLGYEKDFLGLLISIPSFTALILALFAGYVSDFVGRKRAFVLGIALMAASQAWMLLAASTTVFVLGSVLQGVGSSLFSVTASPFLMENSTESERTHLFSFNSGLNTMSSFVGNFLGGRLPLLFGTWMGVAPTSSRAYAGALGVPTALIALSMVPLLFLRVKPRSLAQNPTAPFRVLWEGRRNIARLLLPEFVISLGAGMLIPFLNVFFRERYALPDATIGSLFGFASLGMGLAILGAPLLAERWGKARTTVITRGLSIPFLVALGFVPYLPLAILSFLVRSALMNLSAPVYQTMVMEEADEHSRGMVASLNSMTWNIGWALSPSLSGPLQARYGFPPVFAGTIVAYSASVYMVYRWFVRGAAKPQQDTQ